MGKSASAGTWIISFRTISRIKSIMSHFRVHCHLNDNLQIMRLRVGVMFVVVVPYQNLSGL
jgi:hypothetical protein